ncbi:MAG TPA: hypothetical protein PLK76_00005, partial [bacterium]|nr:hypothetical protein [bacterium]
MKKIIFSLLVLALVVPGPALALYQANSSATVVVGQQYLNYIPGSYNGGEANQGDVANGLYNPPSVYSDGTRLFIADFYNNRVLIYNEIPTSNNASADVVIGQPDLYANTPNNGGIGPNTLYHPNSVYATSSKLFIADYSNNRVLIYNTIPTSNNASADVVIGQEDFTHNSANQGGSVGANTLGGSYNVYSDGTKLYITDGSNHRVLIYNEIPTSNNASADVVVGQANKTTNTRNYGGRSAKSLSYPTSVNTDGSKLIITDSGNDRVLIFNSIPSSDYAEANIVIGQTAMNLAVEGTTASNLAEPFSSFYDGEKLYITDGKNNRVLIFNSIPTENGASADVVVGQNDFVSKLDNQGGSVGANTLHLTPYWGHHNGVFSDGTRLFIADFYNNRVLIYNEIPTSNNASADVVIGQPDLYANTPNNGGIGPNTLYHPNSVYATSSKLFIADYSNNRVLIYNTIPTSNNASADVVIGQEDFTHNSANQGGSVGDNTLKYPVGIFSDGTRLFIADKGNNRVLIYNTIPTSNNASADVVIGQVDMTSGSANRGGSVGANTLWYPMAVYSDGTRLFIADYSNNRVLIYNTIPTSNNASADVVIGQEDFTHNSANQGGSVGANTLGGSYNVYSDGTKLYITDGSNNRVLIYNEIPTKNNASADVVVGQEDLVTDNWPDEATANNIGETTGMTSDGTRLYVVDDAFNRILIYNTIPTENGASADVVIGQPDFTSNDINQNGNVGANTLNLDWWSLSLSVSNDKLFVADTYNSRVLIYPLGPQNSSASAPDKVIPKTV